MANAYLNMARTTTCPDLARYVKQVARLGTTSPATQLSFLGSTSLAAFQAFTRIMNEGTREFLTAMPLLNVTEDTTLVTVADQRHVVLPATLRNCEVLGVWWGDDEDSGYGGKPVDLWSDAAVDRLPEYYRDDEYTVSYPEGVVIGEVSGAAALLFYPIPDQEIELRIKYRAGETVWTLPDLFEAEVTPVLTGTAVSSFMVVTGGANYTSAPTVTVFGGGGHGATGTAVVTSGRVSSVTLGVGGAGYTSAPDASLSGGRAFSFCPDVMIECLAHCIAYRLQRVNTGGQGAEWQALKAEYEKQVAHWALEMVGGPAMLKNLHMGFEGHPRPGLENPMGALGNLGDYGRGY